MKPTRFPLVALALLNLCATSTAGGLNPKKVTLISMTETSEPGEFGAVDPSLSKTGRYVAFLTSSPDLLPGVTPNGKSQVVRKDTKTGELVVVSVNAQGALADGLCGRSALSANGKRIAFTSVADNLDGVSGGEYQVFWKDLVTGELRRISESLASAPADDGCIDVGISDDGNRVVFTSDATNLPGASAPRSNGYVYDVTSALLERVTFGAADVDPNQSSFAAGISGNGRYVCFKNQASNMGFAQAAASVNVFVRDLLLDQTELVNFGENGQVANEGGREPAISKTGRYVSFLSHATNLTSGGTSAELHAFVLDRKKTKIKVLMLPVMPPALFSFATRISSSGRRILVHFAGQNPDQVGDLFHWVAVTDRVSGKSKLFSLSGPGGIGLDDDVYSPALSRQGKKFGFVSNSQLLTPVAQGLGHVFTAKCGKL